jgi:SPP1 gp7 family putative phage head morphogenesis protein
MDPEAGTFQAGAGAAISDWIAKPGSTVGDLNESLTSIFGKARASTIAVTEATRAFSSGEELAYKADGITEWTWVTSNDELTCKYCGAVNGKTVKIGEVFGQFHGKDVTKPPYHPNCRCHVRPKVSRSTVAKPAEFPGNLPAVADVQRPEPAVLARDVFTMLPKNKRLAGNVRRALEATQRVLNIPKDVLSKIPIEQTSGKRNLGAFHATFGGKPIKITISANSKRPEFTTAHEFGHMVDLEGVGTKGKHSSSGGELPDWQQAIQRSQAYLELQQLRFNPYVEIDGQIAYVDPHHVNYLLSPKELFARSFAQYIAVRSDDKIMADQLQQYRDMPGYGSAQWATDDFEPIAIAFDKYFEQIGWRKP